ncbi:hypothetical protein D3C85_1189840 [compost metagenome]
MSAETAHVIAEKTRYVANLVAQGQFSLATAQLVDVARADTKIYDAVLKNLEDYVFKGDLDDLKATVEMVK